MSQTCPTVIIIRDGVEVRINQSDYKPEVHVLAGEAAPAQTVAGELSEMTATELREYAKEHGIDVKGLKSRDDLYKAVTAPNEELFVMPTVDGKYQILTADGNSFTDEIYDTQEDAEKALLGE